MKREQHRLYEGMYILSASLSDDSRKKAFEKITEGITQKGGEVKKVFDQGKRRMCYPIKGKREGHYYVLYFQAPTMAVAELWKGYHLHEDLLRFMTMQVSAVPEHLEFQSIRMQGA